MEIINHKKQDPESAGNPLAYQGESFVQRNVAVPSSVFLRESDNAIFQDLMITWAGCFEKARNHVLHPRILEEEFCILYCSEGYGHLTSDGHEYIVCPGDAFFLFKGVPHSYYADKDRPWTQYWIGFTGEHSEYYLQQLAVTPQNPMVHMGTDSSLVEKFVEALDVLRTGFHPANLLHATACLRYILSRLINLRFDQQLVLTSTITINGVIELMLANLGRALTLDELSLRTGLSKYHLSRKFKESTGYSPLEYFSRLKIQRACELLQVTGSKVKDVSEALGFSSPYYFSIVFKKYTGVSPAHFQYDLHNLNSMRQ